MPLNGPILRIFEVRTKPGCAGTLLQNFATTSADVVQGRPGNQGYFFGQCVQGGEDVVLFVSVWDSLDAVRARFGDDWQVSFMPDGYQDLIEDCFVRHFDMTGGWHAAIPQGGADM